MKRELREMLAFISGLYVANDFTSGGKLVRTAEVN